MKRTHFWLSSLLITLLVLLVACGNREEGAALLLEQAGVAENAGDLGRSEALCRQVLNDFPQTRASGEASQLLKRIERQRAAPLARPTAVFESLGMVLEGYHSLYGTYPVTPDEIDASDYLFDSDYMAEQVPGNAEVFVALGGSDSPYRIWMLPKGGSRGETQAGMDGRPEGFSRDELTGLLGVSLVESARRGSLVFLAPLSMAGR